MKPTIRWRLVDAPDPERGARATRREWRGTWRGVRNGIDTWQRVAFAEDAAPRTQDIEVYALRIISNAMRAAA